jgi:site-specific DNA-methyltransferase (adenine-specific)
MPSNKKKMDITDLLPFNLLGNKAELLADSIGGLLKNGAKNSDRIIDAFAGTGAYIHYLRDSGIDKPMILNEFDPFRFVTHKQIKDNPLAVSFAAEYYQEKVSKKVTHLRNGDRFDSAAEKARKNVVDYMQKEAERLIQPWQNITELKELKLPLKMKNTPELASLYIVMQNQRHEYRPINSDISVKGLRRVMTYGQNKTVANQKEKIKLFRTGGRILRNPRKRILSVSKRLRNVEITYGDGWKLIYEIAGEGDIVLVDTSYLGKTTENYNQFTKEDSDPVVYMEKVRKYILPAFKRGAKFLVTNNWNNEIVTEFRQLGFTVFKAERAKMQSKGKPELIAINFNPASGVLNSRRNSLDNESHIEIMDTIEHGDCIEKLKELDDNFIDLIVTDPPFGIGFTGNASDTFKPDYLNHRINVEEKSFSKRKSNHRRSIGVSPASVAGKYKYTPETNKAFQNFIYEVSKECLRVLKPGAFMFMCMTQRQDSLARAIVGIEDAGFKIGFTSMYWTRASGFSAPQNIGKALNKRFNGEAKKYEGSYAGFQPKPAVEVIIVAMKPRDEKTYMNQVLSNGKGVTWFDDCKIPFDGEDPRFPSNLLVSDSLLYEHTKYFNLDLWFQELAKHLPDEAKKTFPFLIVKRTSEKEKDAGLENRKNTHPTIKPIKLMAYLITMGSRENDIVLDPFAGSGTTCLAAKMLNRRYIGIEIDKEYHEIALRRMKKVWPGKDADIFEISKPSDRTKMDKTERQIVESLIAGSMTPEISGEGRILH